MTNDFKQDSVVKFFGNNPRSQKSLWSADKSFINGIMQSGDEIDSVIDETTNQCEIILALTEILRILLFLLPRQHPVVHPSPQETSAYKTQYIIRRRIWVLKLLLKQKRVSI